MTISQQTMENEKHFLSKYAVQSQNSLGREQPEKECDIRTPFCRDRDRIIHCKAFRRLKYKTQVFLSPEGDHYRTRLTHTLEVAQIARTMARALRLNEDLTEAIALAHDLGHTPFGHAGETALRSVCSGFDHNLQSVRVVQKLERNHKGLNLNKEILNGIANHTWAGSPSTLEGQLVRYADVIAYINHDIDDAIRAEVLTQQDLPKELLQILGDSHSARISTMIRSVINKSKNADKISMDAKIEKALLDLKDFMFQNVYFNPIAKNEETKSIEIIKILFNYFIKSPHLLPDEYKTDIEKEGAEICVIDYIACMTDRYAINLFSKLFVPTVWQK